MRHPLHPAIVHFPVACWSLAVAADFAGLHYGKPAWQLAALLLAIGCGMAVVAMLAGMLELARVPEGPPLRDAWWHMGLMSGALVGFSASLLLRLDGLQAGVPGTGLLALDGIALAALLAGGWFGGRLVYGHGVGRQ